MSAFRKGAMTFLVGLALLTAVVPAAAQLTESRIVGRATDGSSAVLPGVTVTVSSVQTGAVRTAVTDESGSFTVTNLGPGAYKVTFTLDGFATSEVAVILGVGDTKPANAALGIASVSETVNVSAEARVLDVQGAKIGVNVTPEEVQNLPVNGRNFANLMTLATGATSDGNGGWSSVRFNGKSNQQNYLNYDGVDGTYVWDASPGYLNATGSQFRLQTSMESVAEFRVASGLAPAESGLGAGGNITVVTKSGGNAFRGSGFWYGRSDALDSASKYDDRKQELEMNQFGGSLGGPLVKNRTFFFGSYEGLKQTTGLSFTEAVPSDEARRRILAGEPVGSGAGQSPARTQAVAPLLSGFPVGTTPTANPLVALYTLGTQANQTEHTLSGRLDHRFGDNDLFYVRYLYSSGDVDTPDRTVTPRRVRAKQHPQNLMANWQRIMGANLINEFKVGYNLPHTSATAFGPAGYDPTGVSLSGNFTSSSIDARGTTGIARSGLLIRATSASSTTGSAFNPMSLSFANAATWNVGRHTMKFGAEYRRIQSDFQFLGSTEVSYNGINEFIDNRPNTYAVTQDSPVFEPQQYYLVGFVQDTWRLGERLTLDLGLRYDYYSVVKEAQGRAKPFFVEENEFGADPNTFYDGDTNNFAPRVSASYMLTSRTVLRGGFGYYYGPGQFEDRIQPIENYITRNRVQASDVPNNGLAYPVDQALLKSLLSIRGYTHHYPAEYNIQYGVSVQQELPGAINLSVGYTGSQGKDMFLRGVGNVLDPVTRVRPVPSYGQIDFKTGGCVDDVSLAGKYGIGGCGTAEYDAFQVGVTRRFQGGFTGGFNYQVLAQQGHHAGVERGRHHPEHVRLRLGVRHEPAGHPAHLQRVGRLPDSRPGRLHGRLACGRNRERPQRRAGQRDHQPPGQHHGQRRDGDQHPRRQQPRHAAAGPGSRREPVSQRRRALAQPRRVRYAAARHVRQPASELPARPVVRPGRPDGIEGRAVHREPVAPTAHGGLQYRQPAELREPGHSAPERGSRGVVHRRAGRNVWLHARTAEPHGRPRYGTSDSNLGPLPLLDSRGRVRARGHGPLTTAAPPTSHSIPPDVEGKTASLLDEGVYV